MSRVKKTPEDSYIETFTFPAGLDNSEERLQLEAHLAALTDASKAAGKAIQAQIIDWSGDRASLVSYVSGTYHSGNLPTVHNYRELARWTADHYTLHGKRLNSESLRTMFSQEHSRKRP
jgi:hypothetical protein